MDKTYSSNLDSARNDLADDLQNVKDKACEACGAMSDTARHARENARNIIQPILDNVKDRQDDFVSYVRDNPVKSVGIAVLVGVLLNKIL